MNKLISLSTNDSEQFLGHEIRAEYIKRVRSKTYAHKNLCKSLTVEEVLKRFDGMPLRKAQVQAILGRKKNAFTLYITCRFEKEQVMFTIEVGGKALDTMVYSSGFSAPELADQLMKLFNDLERKQEIKEGVWTNFSFQTQNGPKLYDQFLKTPTWDSIKANYTAASQAQLESLLKIGKPWEQGKLVILHGPPGTGKTFFIRALMTQWKKLFKYVAVSDPDRFGADPDYYFSLASESSDTVLALDPSEIAAEQKDKENQQEYVAPDRSIFIMEDAADLVIEESRGIHYDKISKLLNITDGLFGQGREDIFMVSFNEDIKEIDPAFMRPGRCLASINIDLFNRVEAEQWLEKNKHPQTLSKAKYSLADLYKLLFDGKEETAASSTGSRVGF